MRKSGARRDRTSDSAFYLDEMLSPVIAALLRAQGIDAVSALELGYDAVSDEIHLTYAAKAAPSRRETTATSCR